MKLILIIIFTSMIFSEKVKEPTYKVIKKEGDIEIREYGTYVVAKTSISKDTNSDNNMFRTLASYIFGGNKKNESIAMTAPVTTFSDDSNYNMLFYMLDVEEINQLPEHNGQNITFEKFELGKCVTISFSWSTSQSRIEYYSSKLSDFIEKNNLKTNSSFMINRYDPPWRLPFLRRNEIIVRLD